jgi:hypothetical protein
MASGGYRPGAGRKKGSKDTKPRATKTPKKIPAKVKTPKKPLDPEKQKLKEMLSYDIKAKARFYNEFLTRVSKGEKLTIAEKKLMGQLAAELSAGLTDDEKVKAAAENLTPLDYMLKVMNDPAAEKERRDRMAIAAAPFVHTRPGEGKGKKDEKEERARAAGSGKFAAGAAPLKVVK